MKIINIMENALNKLDLYVRRIRPYLLYAVAIFVLFVFPISFSISISVGTRTIQFDYLTDAQRNYTASDSSTSHTMSLFSGLTQTGVIIDYDEDESVVTSVSEPITYTTATPPTPPPTPVATPVSINTGGETNEEGIYIFETFEANNVDTERLQAFVERFYRIAQAEETSYGIPASVTLAQALLESNVGRSRLTSKFNNYFGIKCTAAEIRNGECEVFEDDTPTDNFRTYDNAWLSFRHHSQLLQKPRYSKCYDGDSYQEWCDCLSASGYATDPNYSSKLQRIIRTYRLYQFDA